ncbi:MAG: hypothetical protein K0Q72_2674 [Armatimonadetes bacterium]|jgi:ubiquinone/menaquinone biosynthesis C-methylase UbiE|nr:hypothetical protein [Armatimonadota bacterium]
MLPVSPRWKPAELREIESERAQRDREADQYDQLLGLRWLSRWEIPATLQPLSPSAEDRVLEVGCGTGRFTQQLVSRCRELIAVDHSYESLSLLRRKLSPELQDRYLLIQADAAQLPVRAGWATCALSCQMLEHLPSHEIRQAALAELARVLAAGGRLALSGYWHAPLLRPFLQREGKHSGAIYFHRFTRAEFRSLLERDFRIESLSGRLVYLLLAHATRRELQPGE